MEDIDKRLRDTSDQCIKSYEAWNGDKKNTSAREALQEAVHELRKVASRVEIEVAVSERAEMTQKPIPIPAHRDARNRGGNNNDDRGNRAPKPDNGGAPKPRGKRAPAPKPKKADDAAE